MQFVRILTFLGLAVTAMATPQVGLGEGGDQAADINDQINGGNGGNGNAVGDGASRSSPSTQVILVQALTLSQE